LFAGGEVKRVWVGGVGSGGEGWRCGVVEGGAG
jgi:hypothetical protein